MIFSENRCTFFGIMLLLVEHDLVRKPLHSFRDHAPKYPEMNRAASPGGTVEPYYFYGLARSTSRKSDSIKSFDAQAQQKL
jgi:hypothetical protein